MARPRAPPRQPGRDDAVRSLLHRRAPRLPPRPLLLPRARGRESMLCHHLGRRRQSAERRDYGRSEEHTSEIQSLMRISYAVICLKYNTTPINKKVKPNTKQEQKLMQVK